jgi:hypothetical protein
VDAIEVVVDSLGNVLLGYHGHECNEPLPGYRRLAIVGHVGCPTIIFRITTTISTLCIIYHNNNFESTDPLKSVALQYIVLVITPEDGL